MKKLIFICGASGIGKSTICKKLYKTLHNTALVDSDHCRLMNPFTFTDEEKAIVEDNMATMLTNYLKCSTIKNVIFLYGLHGPRQQIFNNIMTRLSDAKMPYQLTSIILECEFEENLRRSRLDGRSEAHIKYFTEHTRDIYNQYDYPRLDITLLNVEEAVSRLIEMVND